MFMLRRSAVSLLLFLGLSVREQRVFALECDPGICQGNPCTIATSHQLEPDCTLDFSGKDVTIGPNSRLASGTSGSLSIKARNLTVLGTIQFVNGWLNIDVDQDFRTGRTPGQGTISGLPSRDINTSSNIQISAGGDVILAGSTVFAAGSEASLLIYGNDVAIGSSIDIEGGPSGEGTDLEVFAGGRLQITTRIKMKGSQYGGPSAYFYSGGDIEIDAPIQTDKILPSYFYFSAGQNLIVNAAIRAQSSSAYGGSSVILLANGNVAVNAMVDARGHGSQAGGGDIEIAPLQPSGNVTIAANILDSGPDTAYSSQAPTIYIGPACTASIKGKLDARGDHQGSITIWYVSQLDLAGAKLFADPASSSFYGGGNTIGCACTGVDSNLVCHGGCIADPTGLSRSSARPPVTIAPTQLDPCS